MWNTCEINMNDIQNTCNIYILHFLHIYFIFILFYFAVLELGEPKRRLGPAQGPGLGPARSRAAAVLAPGLKKCEKNVK